MQIVSKGIAFNSIVHTNRQSLMGASICVLAGNTNGGRWLVSCRAAPEKGPMTAQHILLSWSDDEGATWSTPSAPFNPPEVDGKPGLFRSAYLTTLGDGRVLAALNWVDHSEPSLPMFNEETQGLLDFNVFLAHSDDGGETWSTPRCVDTSPFDQPTPLTGPILLCKNGDWALQFELNKDYYEESEWHHKSVLMLSSDEGQTWPKYSLASSDSENRVFYWDQRPNVLQDGTLLDLFWTYDNGAAKYLNIHARASKDNGRTWGEIWDTDVPGQPAPPVEMADGKLLMVYVDRESTPSIKARVCVDDGRTWPVKTETLLYEMQLGNQTENKGSMQDAWSEMRKFSLGLPATTNLPSSGVLVVFYAGPRTDETDIHWVRLEA